MIVSRDPGDGRVAAAERRGAGGVRGRPGRVRIVLVLAVALARDRRLRRRRSTAGADRFPSLRRPQRLHVLDPEPSRSTAAAGSGHAAAERRRSGQREGATRRPALPHRRSRPAGRAVGRAGRGEAGAACCSTTGSCMVDQRGTGDTAIRCPLLQAQVGTSDIAVPGARGGAGVRREARAATRGLYSTDATRRRPGRPQAGARRRDLDDRRRLLRHLRRRALCDRPPEGCEGARARLGRCRTSTRRPTMRCT